MKTFINITRHYVILFAVFFTSDVVFHDLGSKIDPEISPLKKLSPYTAGLMGVAVFVIADLVSLAKANRKRKKSDL